MNTYMVGLLNKQRRSGFTIVELIVVIAVIAILAGIVIVSYGAWRTSVATSSLKSDLSHAASAMESSRGFSGSSSASGYPSTIPSTFSASQNNTISLTSISAQSYCIDGTTSVNTSVKYYIDNTIQSKGPATGTCAARTNLPLPAKPLSLVFSSDEDGIQVQWQNTVPNNALRYTAQCAKDPAFITGLLTANVDGSDNTYAGMAYQDNAATYYCRVRGENNNGVGPWSDTVSGVTTDASAQ